MKRFYPWLFASIFHLGAIAEGSDCYACEFNDLNPCFLHPVSFFGGIEVGYRNFYQLPDFIYAQIGFTTDPFFNFENEHARSPYVEASLGIGILPQCCADWLGLTSLTLSAHYSKDKKESNVDSEIDSFFVFIDGSSIFGIDAPITSEVSRDYQFFGGDFNVNSRYLFCACGNPFSIAPYFQFGVHRFEQTYKIDFLGNLGVASFGSLKETLKTTFFDVGPGLEVTYYFLSNFSIFAKCGIFASYAYTEFSGDEFYNIPGTFFNAVTINENHRVWNSKVKARAGITYFFCNLLFEFVGNYEYWGYTPGIENPSILNIVPASVINRNASFYSLGGKISSLF